jgi:hypothetical protein
MPPFGNRARTTPLSRRQVYSTFLPFVVLGALGVLAVKSALLETLNQNKNGEDHFD